MKKRDLMALVESIARETLKEEFVTKRSHLKKYRRSKYHPDEKKQAKFHPSPFAVSREPAYEIPEPVKILLNSALKMLSSSDPLAQKALQGIAITKQEAMQLARTVMGIAHFPIQQPRKLMNLLILLAIENQPG